MRRRHVLGGVATAIAGIAGCASDGDAFEEANSDETPDSPPTTTFARSDPGTVLRGRGESISVERSVADEPGYDDDIEYFPANGTVKVVAARSGDQPAWFETMSVEEWGAIQCAEAGLERTRDVLAERLNSRRFDASIGQPPDGRSASAPSIIFTVETRLGPADQRITPAIPVRRLAARAPRAVDATVTLDGDTVSREVPVFAAHRTIGGD
jgi:hypothetical protein